MLYSFTGVKTANKPQQQKYPIHHFNLQHVENYAYNNSPCRFHRHYRSFLKHCQFIAFFSLSPVVYFSPTFIEWLKLTLTASQGPIVSIPFQLQYKFDR